MARMVSAIVLLALALSVMWVPPEAQAGRDVFRWRDADGVMHFGDRPGAPELATERAVGAGQTVGGSRPRPACPTTGQPQSGTRDYRERVLRWYENCR